MTPLRHRIRVTWDTSGDRPSGCDVRRAGPWSADPPRTVTLGSIQASRGSRGSFVGSVIKKRRKRMAKKKHRKLLKKTRVQRRRLGK